MQRTWLLVLLVGILPIETILAQCLCSNDTLNVSYNQTLTLTPTFNSYYCQNMSCVWKIQPKYETVYTVTSITPNIGYYITDPEIKVDFNLVLNNCNGGANISLTNFDTNFNVFYNHYTTEQEFCITFQSFPYTQTNPETVWTIAFSLLTPPFSHSGFIDVIGVTAPGPEGYSNVETTELRGPGLLEVLFFDDYNCYGNCTNGTFYFYGGDISTSNLITFFSRKNSFNESLSDPNSILPISATASKISILYTGSSYNSSNVDVLMRLKESTGLSQTTNCANNNNVLFYQPESPWDSINGSMVALSNGTLNNGRCMYTIYVPIGMKYYVTGLSYTGNDSVWLQGNYLGNTTIFAFNQNDTDYIHYLTFTRDTYRDMYPYNRGVFNLLIPPSGALQINMSTQGDNYDIHSFTNRIKGYFMLKANSTKQYVCSRCVALFDINIIVSDGVNITFGNNQSLSYTSIRNTTHIIHNGSYILINATGDTLLNYDAVKILDVTTTQTLLTTTPSLTSIATSTTNSISTSVSTTINTTSVNITPSASTKQPGGHGTIIKIDIMNMFALILFVLFIY